MDPARYQRLLHEFGLDRPLHVQYADYVWRALHGDLGLSTITHEPVFREFIARFPATIELSVCAMLFALLIGLPAGIIAAVKRNTVLGLLGDGRLADRLLDADLLVGPAADPDLLGAGSAGRRCRAASRSSSTSRRSPASC